MYWYCRQQSKFGFEGHLTTGKKHLTTDNYLGKPVFKDRLCTFKQFSGATGVFVGIEHRSKAVDTRGLPTMEIISI